MFCQGFEVYIGLYDSTYTIIMISDNSKNNKILASVIIIRGFLGLINS